MSSRPAAGLVIVGRVRKAHGIRGELVVEPLTDEPDAVFAAGRRVFAGTADGDVAEDRGTLTVAGARAFKGGWIVATNEIHDRTVADTWRGRYLLVPADELSPPGEGEVYLHDLIGLRVELGDGTLVGEVTAFYELPQGIVLDVKRERGTVMIPFSEDVIGEVDVPGGRVVIDPPAGLLDE